MMPDVEPYLFSITITFEEMIYYRVYKCLLIVFTWLTQVITTFRKTKIRKIDAQPWCEKSMRRLDASFGVFSWGFNI